MTLLEYAPVAAPVAPAAASVDAAELLVEAMERYRESEQDMRRRLQESMGMNPSDLHALRLLVAARGEGRTMSPKDLASRLGFSSASVTALLNRLEASGHLKREAHASDRRGLTVVSTPTTDDDMRARLGRMHGGMIEAAGTLDPAAAESVIHALDLFCDALDAPGAA